MSDITFFNSSLNQSKLEEHKNILFNEKNEMTVQRNLQLDKYSNSISSFEVSINSLSYKEKMPNEQLFHLINDSNNELEEKVIKEPILFKIVPQTTNSLGINLTEEFRYSYYKNINFLKKELGDFRKRKILYPY